MNCFLRIVSCWTNNRLLFRKILSIHLKLGRLRGSGHKKESEAEVLEKTNKHEMYLLNIDSGDIEINSQSL